MAQVTEIQKGMQQIMTSQEHLTQDVTAIEGALSSFNSTVSTGFSTLSAEIQALQQQPGAGNLDFSGLDQAVTDVSTALSTAATDLASAVTAAAPPTPPPAAPTVTGVSDVSTGGAGTDAGGDAVQITGTGFTGATAVNFGATPATAFTVNSDTSITATSPAGSTGTVDVTVVTPAGTSATSAADQFSYA